MRLKVPAWLRISLEIILLAFFSVVLTVGAGIYNLAWYSPKVPAPVSPADQNLTFESTRLVTADGVKLAAWYVPRRAGTSRSAVIVLPDFTLDKGAIFPHVAFLAEQFNVLALDFRRAGESEAAPSTVAIREQLDLQAAIAWLQGRGINNIGVYGFGVGGSIALTAAARNEDVLAAVAEGAYADLREAVHAPFQPFGVAREHLINVSVWLGRTSLGLDLDDASPRQSLKEIGDKPLLVIHASGDTLVPLEQAEVLRAAIAGDPQAEFWLEADAIRGQGSAEFARRVTEFFQKHLP
ncbi:hypothetical protein A3C96_03385 [Candidatus Uhrbacteria bacterium RIFCSPHIGHO2_02_FULL_60_10]|uniref:AB hydrolase-1 domain-containing protein n=1 Tax=Candidatus Uhrbacteria bacterium RIFCSPHIGHO2_02_FULL_60_10 TaxID=1802392 RepID=A0A1F7U4U8_9BACT|nr:MAG: hypothetical protein A3C96_03385 [Candidatus Uhrbacteria bacterium RIFCSPHIGHO2_02_FULL_60_10]